MNKNLAAAMLITSVGLIGCSALDSKTSEKDVVEPTLTQDLGGITLTVDAKGQFVSLKAEASAQVREDSPAGKESAATVAAGRAKRNIVEFLNTDIKSHASISNFSKETHQDSEHAQEVLEKISEDAQGILRGVYISRQSLDSDTARVELTVSKSSMRIALTMRQQMRSGGSN